GALLSGGLRVREHGRVPRRRGGRALGAIGSNGRAARPRAALAPAGAGDAALPALARRYPVRGRLLGEALRVLGGGRGGALLARARRRRADGGRPVLLPRRREADVHR